MLAVIGEPGTTWTSECNRLLLTMLDNTGARVAEIIAVHMADAVLDASACVPLDGQGRDPTHRSPLVTVGNQSETGPSLPERRSGPLIERKLYSSI